jgi:hypothetical protein
VDIKKLIGKPVQDFIMSCEKATYLLTKSQYQKLSFIKKMHLQLHLLTCGACTQFAKQLKYLSIVFEKLKKSVDKVKIDEKYKTDIQINIDKIIQNEKKD